MHGCWLCSIKGFLRSGCKWTNLCPTNSFCSWMCPVGTVSEYQLGSWVAQFLVVKSSCRTGPIYRCLAEVPWVELRRRNRAGAGSSGLVTISVRFGRAGRAIEFGRGLALWSRSVSYVLCKLPFQLPRRLRLRPVDRLALRSRFPRPRSVVF
jgi:hypothetical protein